MEESVKADKPQEKILSSIKRRSGHESEEESRQEDDESRRDESGRRRSERTRREEGRTQTECAQSQETRRSGGHGQYGSGRLCSCRSEPTDSAREEGTNRPIPLRCGLSRN